MKRILPILLAVTAVSCGSDPTGPDLLISFMVDRHDPFGGELPSTVAVAGAASITITGGIGTPCLAVASEISGLAFLDGDDLALQVMWESANACTPGLDQFTYEAVLGGLDSGTYHLTVSNIFSPTSGFVTLTTDVTVP